MKTLLVALLLMVGVSFAQSHVTHDNQYNTFWQDSLTTADTSDIIALNSNYDYVYLVAQNTGSTTDSVRVESGTIGYSYGVLGLNPAYVAHDTIWALVKVDSMGTYKTSSLINFPKGTTEYSIENHTLQLLRITLFNKNTSTIFYRVKAIKHKSY